MKHVPLTRAKLRSYIRDLAEATVSARRALDVVSPASNATDGSIRVQDINDLHSEAKRTVDQVAALIAALERKPRTR